jgi:CelD/BcsL family acetyltransferase involved in cellulose biosynthesis
MRHPTSLSAPGAIAGLRAQGRLLNWEIAPVSWMHRYEACWQQLHRAGWPTPVLAYDFAAALLHGFARGDETLVIARAEDRRPVAMGVLERHSRFGWSTFQPSQAPIGIWLHDPAWDIGAVLRSLLRVLPGPALVVGLTQQDPLRAPRPEHALALSTLDYIQTGSVLVNRSFEAYWGERDKKVRYEMKRRLARLAEQGLEPRLETLRDASTVPEQVAAFGELESAGWKAGLGTAVQAGNAQGAFYRDLLVRFCRHGAARIYRYVANGRVLAMQLCIEHDGTLAFLKTTYDERLRASAPGVLMKAEIFRELFRDGGVRRIEFYGSIKEWQLKWIDSLRTQYHVNAYRSALVSAAHAVAARMRGARRKAAPAAAAQARTA